MSDIAKRLRASVNFDAVNGNSRERAIVANQMREAAGYIDMLERDAAKLERVRELRDSKRDSAKDLINNKDKYPDRKATISTAFRLQQQADELSAILEQVELLQPFLTSHAAPHAVTQRTTLRSDVPGPDGLAVPPSYLAPEWRDGFFTVPRLPPHDAAE